MNLKNYLYKKVIKAAIISGIDDINHISLRHSNKEIFGEYQISGIIRIANKLNKTPRFIAKNIVNNLNIKNILYKIKIVQPGFINLFIHRLWLANQAELMFNSINFDIKKQTDTVIIDYSSPNIAKEMHVGHLRSTILGDTTVRILKFLGYKVIKVNHIGDWGTQFGMLIAYLETNNIPFNNKITLKKLEKYYCLAKKEYKKNKDFEKKTKICVVKLQKKNIKYYSIWKKITKITINYNQNIYHLLNITLKKKNILGESFYNDKLSLVVNDLIKKNIAIKNNGSTIVLSQKFKDKNNNDLGIVIKKKDGRYLYTTIDIACLKYRCNELKAKHIIYYVDSRQKQHFDQVYEISLRAGYIPKNIKIEYHFFGMILNKNNHPFKTRNGDNIKLLYLIHKVIKKTKKLIIKKNNKKSLKRIDHVANIIAVGAIKYYDLSKDRKINYVFNLDKMLSFEGNTALYIQYNYARIKSIINKSKKYKFNKKNNLIITNGLEAKIIFKTLQFEEILVRSAKQGKYHILCEYLYNITNLFSKYYQRYPIIQMIKNEIGQNRLKISILVSRIIKQSLNILGIKTVDKI
ncbi:arginine--tRNA ligase [Candidatus Purcelliella pentastirinorum]|uniref:Arginine--tRNA ligase n=1 Tax=Candidatus Purcelliella pentastirinorum TaxID=472834 RepID=A0AAX3N8D1_9ENTR|nr:arginine--tRNA ligase [Candidatus Purcelliella pentastirinorum]WDI78701.1 arginine--tRNA ligase [Candidatus Purcelliella pentastirinorum]WDR80687.1 arginine--tRNA ligase [Candidatus Purcelliella pentastirinorum]